MTYFFERKIIYFENQKGSVLFHRRQKSLEGELMMTDLNIPLRELSIFDYILFWKYDLPRL